MKHIGHIKLHRAIQDNPFYLSEPFTKVMAWIDLLLNAKYEDEMEWYRGSEIIVKRGQLVVSLGELSKKWKWPKSKVQRFLDYLERENAIERPIRSAVRSAVQNAVRTPVQLSSLISIVNYDKYQTGGTNTDTKCGTMCDTHIKEYNNIINNNIALSTHTRESNSPKNSSQTAPQPPPEAVERIYAFYPSKCPIKGRPTGKCKADKAKIARLLKEMTEEELMRRIRKYLNDCVRTDTPIKNLSTLLNNLPDENENTIGEWRPTTQPRIQQANKPSKLDQYKAQAQRLGLIDYDTDQSNSIDEQ